MDWVGGQAGKDVGELLADRPSLRVDIIHLGCRNQAVKDGGALAARRGLHDALARQVLGEGLSGRPLAREGRYRQRLGPSLLGGDLVLGGADLQLLQL